MSLDSRLRQLALDNGRSNLEVINLFRERYRVLAVTVGSNYFGRESHLGYWAFMDTVHLFYRFDNRYEGKYSNIFKN